MDNKKQRIVLYGVTAFVAGAVIAGAAFQEQIGYFVRLRGWDPEGPANSVSAFLSAGLRGDQAGAARFLGSKEMKPLEKDGKWVGYLLRSNAGNLEYIMKDLAPSEGTKRTSLEYIYVGRGAAKVTMPDAKGAAVPYRLEMMDNTWKITEILGGKSAP